MRSKQYYRDTENNTVYCVSICVGNSDECIESVNLFVKEWDEKNMLILFINTDCDITTLSSTIENINDNIKNHIMTYSYVSSIKEAISIVDHTQTIRYNYFPWVVQGGLNATSTPKVKQQQYVFNITKEYLREEKLKNILK